MGLVKLLNMPLFDHLTSGGEGKGTTQTYGGLLICH